MKTRIHQLLLVLTGALVLGTSSLLAKETSQQSLPILKKELLAQSETNINVEEYLKKKKPESYKFLQKELDEAVQDAKIPSPDKIVNNLWALSIGNPKIKTRTTKNGQTEFLMVTWSSKKYWKLGPNEIKQQTWLTASNQVKEFCHTCKGLGIDIPGNIMLSLRLDQYIGLTLKANKTDFVEMWVKAKDLIRPCINREIKDSSCQVLPVPVPDSDPVLKKIYKNSYENTENYPWTGLGYTYDWGNSQKPHVGASEFIIEPTLIKDKPMQVEVVSVTDTQEYCNNQYLK